MSRKIIRFFNITEPVTTYLKDIGTVLSEKHYDIEFYTSDVIYRRGRMELNSLVPIVIRRTRSYGLSYTGIKKIFVAVFYCVGSAVRSLFGGSVGINIFLTQPPLFFFWGAILKIFRKQPFLVVLMDLYPWVASGAGFIDEDHVLFKLLSSFSVLGLKASDGIVVIGRLMREKVRNLGIEEDKITFIPNWVDQAKIRPSSIGDNNLRKQMGWDDKFVVMYSGNLGVSHTFDDFLQAVKVLQKEEKILFAVIGGGTRLNEICDFKTKYQLENLDILPFQPEDHLADSLSAGDVHYVSLRKEFSGLVVPSKVYGIMAAGRPFIFQGENETEPALMIRNERIGTVVPNNSPDLLVEAVLSYFHDPETVARQGRRARELSETKYSKQRAVKLYTRLVTDIMELG